MWSTCGPHVVPPLALSPFTFSCSFGGCGPLVVLMWSHLLLYPWLTQLGNKLSVRLRRRTQSSCRSGRSTAATQSSGQRGHAAGRQLAVGAGPRAVGAPAFARPRPRARARARAHPNAPARERARALARARARGRDHPRGPPQ